jgi:hypothetical protein
MTDHDLPPIEEPRRRKISAAQWTLATLIIALACGGVLYRVLAHARLEQTAALFIGLPAVLAALLALSPRAEGATATILKGMTIALLMSGPVLAEGFICVVMAAPLFYLVGIVVGLIIDHSRRKDRPIGLRVLILLPLLVASMEGTTPGLTLPAREAVTVTRMVSAAPADVERALGRAPRFDAKLPPFLRMKFPLPAAASGDGLAIGAARTIHFAGGEGKPGDLLLRVTGRGPASVTFTAQSDTSHIAHWLTWRSSHVSWRAAGDGRTEVRWTIVYDRELDPAWYFGPWERYATRLAAGYLIDTLATPR